MLEALSKAVGQTLDPAFRAVAVKTVLISVALSAGLVVLAGWALSGLALFDIGWLDSVLQVLGGLAAVVLALLLFPAVATLVVGFFLEDIADAVEARHYAGLPPAPGQPVASSLASAVRLMAVAIGLNLLVLPVYLVPGINVFVFFGLNGYLLGREYFELVAMRRLDARAATAMRRRFRWRVFLGGILITALLSVPVINWLMPMVATAFMVHEFEGIRRRAAPA